MLIIAMITAPATAAIVSAAIFRLLIRECFIAFSFPTRRKKHTRALGESVARRLALRTVDESAEKYTCLREGTPLAKRPMQRGPVERDTS
jgi:hypothetical protein